MLLALIFTKQTAFLSDTDIILSVQVSRQWNVKITSYYEKSFNSEIPSQFLCRPHIENY
jgi:hypothetical protein